MQANTMAAEASLLLMTTRTTQEEFTAKRKPMMNSKETEYNISLLSGSVFFFFFQNRCEHCGVPAGDGRRRGKTEGIPNFSSGSKEKEGKTNL